MYSHLVLGLAILFLGASQCNSNLIRGNSSMSASEAGDSEALTTTISRRLVENFVPLRCNAAIGKAPCSSFVTMFGNGAVRSNRVIIPCGKCVTMDYPGPQLTLNDGIDIRGKLVFPDGYRLTVRTNLVSVQGELEMRSSKPVDGNPDVRFVMQGTESASFAPISSNAAKCGGNCDAGARSIAVAGGKVNLNGLPTSTPTWLHVHDVIGSSAIVVSNSVRNKWGAGATIVITSEHQGYFGEQVRKITSISDVGSNSVRLNLDQPINRPVTLRDSPDFATEVALLSRNIVFEGAPGTKGGHFWIMHTPRVRQRIEGVELVNFGQEGLLGRYPVHFHMCGDVSGSVVVKNTIRNSNQRCVVVHGTNNLLVQENVAYFTKGHCYMLEDGIETGNQFVRNIGIRTVKPEIIIPNMGSNGKESDMTASTFWITNADNSWIGNVVAGSEALGFWFELLVRGNLANEHQDFDPMMVPTRKFEGNVVHSVYGVGMTYYLSGYIPETLQYFKNNKFFRNHHLALRIHRARNIVLTGNKFSDNRYAIRIDRDEEIHVTDTTIVGYSDLFKDVVRRNRFAQAPCAQGISFQSTNPWKDKMDSELNGVILDKVRFSGFSNAVCSSSTAIELDSRLDGYKSFEMFSQYSGATVSDANSIDFCRGKSAGARDVYVSDTTGSLLDGVASAPSTLMVNSPELASFVNPSACTENAARCYTYCSNTCFRTVHYYVPVGQSRDYKLKVCDRKDASDCTVLSGYVHSNHPWPRRFAVHVPSGREYDTYFLDKGVPVYPTNVEIVFQEKLCPTAPDDDDIALLYKARGTTFPPTPSPTTALAACGNLIANSDFERGFNGYWDAQGAGTLSTTAGYESATAMYYASGNRNRYWVGPSHQWREGLDLKCLKQGTIWEFSARLKLVDSKTGRGASCDPGSSSGGEMCPQVQLIVRDQSWTQHSFRISGFDGGDTWVANGFNEFKGYWTIPANGSGWQGGVANMRVILSEFPFGMDLVVDNFSMVLTFDTNKSLAQSPTLSPVLAVPPPTQAPIRIPTQAPVRIPAQAPIRTPNESPLIGPGTDLNTCAKMIANSNFDLGYEGYWSVPSGGSLSNKEGFSSSTSMYYDSGNRRRYWIGPEYKWPNGVDYGCLLQGTTWKFTAKFQLIDAATGKGSSCSVNSSKEGEMCPRVRLTLRDDGWTLRNVRIDGFSAADTWDANGMNSFTGYWTVPENGPDWQGRVRNIRLAIADFPFDKNLVVDDFQMAFFNTN